MADRRIAHPLGEVTNAAEIAASTGTDVAGYTRVVENYGLRHTLRTHGSDRERLRGQLTVVPDDLHRIPDVVREPDTIRHGGRSKEGREMIVSERTIDGVRYSCSEEVRTGRRTLVQRSMWKAAT